MAAGKKQYAEIIAIAMVSTAITLVMAHFGVIDKVNRHVVRKVVK